MKEVRIMIFPPFILTEFSSHNFDNDDIEITIDNCVFKAITDRSRLSAEGVKLKHCISEYHSKCLNKSYVAFSIKDNSDYAVSGSKSNQNKYTLGLQVAQRSNCEF